MFITRRYAEIKRSTIEIRPINVWFRVKNVKHQTMLRVPFIINRVIVDVFKFSLLIQLQRTIANIKYITLHTIGIIKLGINWRGFLNKENQSIPIFTKMLPKIAIPTMLEIIMI